MLFTTFVVQDYPQGYILSYIYKLLGVLFVSKMLDEFSLSCIFHHVWEECFQFMVFTFLENAMNLCSFTHAPVPQSKIQAGFLKLCFSQDNRDGENYDLLYRNSIKNMKMTWNFRLFIFYMICNFSKLYSFVNNIYQIVWY